MKRFFVISLVLLGTAVVSGAPQEERSASIVTIDANSYYVHTVQGGQTLYSLSRLYSVPEQELIRSNPQVEAGLQAGQVIKIPVVKDSGEREMTERQIKRLFDIHTVNQGETLYSISHRYEISVATLLEDNEGLDPASLSIGQRINIRKKSQGDTTPEQIKEELQEYRDAVNSVSGGTKYHLIVPGETIYGLSKTYGVSEEDIIVANDLRNGLRAGDMIKIPGDGEAFPTVGDAVAGEGKGESVERQWIDDSWKTEIAVADLSQKEVIEVALMLPLKVGESPANRGFIEFYKGVLLGLEELKAEGISTNLSLYNTSRSLDSVREIVDSPDFQGSDIIIGPVYEENLPPVLDFAQRNGRAVVFPLAALEGEGSPVLYQMPPPDSTKYDKLLGLLAVDKNIVYVTTSQPDKDMDEGLRPHLSASTRTLQYARNVSATAIAGMLDRKGENVFVISCDDEFTVDEILAKISSMQNNIVARGTPLDLHIVGSSRWARFRGNMDRNLYFKLRLSYVTNYHVDRGNDLVRDFDGRYIGAFGTIPTPYSYRGYDAAKLFVGAAKAPGADFTAKVNENARPLLQMSYEFSSDAPGGTLVNNDNWALVRYGSDYTIEVK